MSNFDVYFYVFGFLVLEILSIMNRDILILTIPIIFLYEWLIIMDVIKVLYENQNENNN